MIKPDYKRRASLLMHEPTPYDFPKARLDIGSGLLQKEEKTPVTEYKHKVITVGPNARYQRVVELKRAFRANNLLMLGLPEDLRRLLLVRFEVGNVSVLAVSDPISCGMFFSSIAHSHSLDIPTLSPDAALRLDFENPTDKEITFAAWLTGNVREEVTS